MRGAHWLAVVAWIHLALVVVAAGGWVWSAWWHTAVEAASDDQVRMGVVDAAAVPAVIDGYPSLGVYLQQGWDRKSLGWAYALCLLTVSGSLMLVVGATAAMRRHARGQAVQGGP